MYFFQGHERARTSGNDSVTYLLFSCVYMLLTEKRSNLNLDHLTYKLAFSLCL